MGAICTLIDRAIESKRSTTSNPSQWFIDWVQGGVATSSGVQVNAQSALKYTPFWAGVRIISGTLAELPFIVYSRLEKGGKDRQQGHRVYKLLHDRPNDYMDALTFRETRQAHVLTYGNGYAEIQRDGAGRAIALWPLMPDRTQRKIRNGVPYYEVRLPVGGTVKLPDQNVLHIKGLGFDGYSGYNVVQYHKEAIGYGIAVKEYGARFFSNDAAPGGVLEHPASLSDKAEKHLKESWNAGHTGLKQAHRMAILEEGMTWKQQGVDPKTAQALEVQKYTVDDCSRIFQIPPHLLGSMDRATFNNIEEQNLKFLTMTMLYWFRKWEMECNYKLFSATERPRLFAEILYDALLRGDIQKRYAAYQIGRLGGWLSVNMILEKENMNPIGPKGDIFLEPLNMKEAGTVAADADNDNTDRALRGLVDEAVTRVVTKQSKTGYQIDSHRWAFSILMAPVRAIASLRGITMARADDVLDRALAEYMRPKVAFDATAGDRLIEEITQKIGGNHAD